MRRIIKGAEPDIFGDWKSLANENWTPTFNNLQNPEKAVLQDALIREQGGLCCYCGRAINCSDSHIEHFRPQEHFPELALDFSNLFASCIRQQKPDNPIHCGHCKGKWFDEALAISPLHPDCEQRFSYDDNGEIVPTDGDDRAAKTMILELNLGAIYLRNRRAEALAGMFDTAFLESATTDELQAIADAYEARDREDLQPFAQVVFRYAQQLISDAAGAGATV